MRSHQWIKQAKLLSSTVFVANLTRHIESAPHRILTYKQSLECPLRSVPDMEKWQCLLEKRYNCVNMVIFDTMILLWWEVNSSDYIYMIEFVMINKTPHCFIILPITFLSQKKNIIYANRCYLHDLMHDTLLSVPWSGQSKWPIMW